MFLKYKVIILLFVLFLIIHPISNVKAHPGFYEESVSISVDEDGSLTAGIMIRSSEITFEGVDIDTPGWTGCLGAFFFLRRGELPPMEDMGEMLMFLPELGFIAIYPGGIMTIEDAISSANQIASQFETAFQTTLHFDSSIEIPMDGEKIYIIVYTPTGSFEDFTQYFTKYSPSNSFSKLFNADRFMDATGALIVFGVENFEGEGFSQMLMAQCYQKWYFTGKGSHVVGVRDVFGIETPITTYSLSNRSSIEIEVPQNATITDFYPSNATVSDNTVSWGFGPAMSVEDANVTFIYDFALNITVVKSIDKETIKEGGIVEITINVINNDNETAYNVTLSDTDVLKIYNVSIEVVEGSPTYQIGELKPGDKIVYSYKIKVDVEGYYTLLPAKVTYSWENRTSIAESNPVYLRVLPLQVQEIISKIITEHPVPSAIFLATVVYISFVKISGWLKKKKKPEVKETKPEEEEEEFTFFE